MSFLESFFKKTPSNTETPPAIKLKKPNQDKEADKDEKESYKHWTKGVGGEPADKTTTTTDEKPQLNQIN